MDFALTLECYREKCKPVDLVTKKKNKPTCPPRPWNDFKVWPELVLSSSFLRVCP